MSPTAIERSCGELSDPLQRQGCIASLGFASPHVATEHVKECAALDSHTDARACLRAMPFGDGNSARVTGNGSRLVRACTSHAAQAQCARIVGETVALTLGFEHAMAACRAASTRALVLACEQGAARPSELVTFS